MNTIKPHVDRGSGEIIIDIDVRLYRFVFMLPTRETNTKTLNVITRNGKRG